MKITLSHIVEHGSISAAIEALCKESDTVASGVIGSSFSCSGPGSGWQRNCDVTDYAARALAGDYGAEGYIDSSDGTEAIMTEIQYWMDLYSSGSANELSGPFSSLGSARACLPSEMVEAEIEPCESTMGCLSEHGLTELVEAYLYSQDSGEYIAIYKTGGELEWSDESVVEIEMPSVEEALESPIAWGVIRASAADYGVAQDDIDDLDCRVATPYMVCDSAGVTERASTLEELAGIIEDWYDHLLDDGKLEVMPDPGLDSSSLGALESSTRDWENRIAEAMGYTEFAGRGSYRVSAASEAGLYLTIGLRD